MKRKVLLIFTALIIISSFFFTACGGGSDNGGGGASSGGGSTSGGAASGGGSGSGSAAASGDLDDNDTILIGAMTYMTGTNMVIGEYITPAFELARDEINAAGGLLGKQIELAFVDQGSEQQTAINATMMLLNNDKINAIVGPNSSANTVAVIDTLKDYPILYMANGSSVNIAKEKIEHVYQIRMTDDLGGAILAKAMVEQYGLKKPAIMYMNDTFGEGLAIAIKEFLKSEYDIEPAVYLNFDPTNERNFAPFFTQILNSDADSLIAIGGQLQGPVIMQQAKNVEYPYPMFCNSSLMSADVIDMAEGAADGWLSIADWSSEIQTTEGKHFVDAYFAKTGRLPNVYAVYAYDAMQVVFEAIRIAGTTNRAPIIEAMKQINKLPVSMSTMTYRENHSLADSMLFVEVQDGIPVVLDFVPRPE
ncbi:MAG: ABC transporter substrate-binding protein [Oscillospiraceae bacterium]|nr:ABC transporter substrate-binding protein [Oscillospiraceae bacterium]